MQEAADAEVVLERAAATVLGQVLFEFGRLELELALFLAWSDGGKQLKTLSEQLVDDPLHAKLCHLQQRASAKYSKVPAASTAFGRWLEAAHAARTQRNEFVHGRWGIAATEGRVVNVIGIPTLATQREVRYSLTELEESLNRIKLLRPQLHALRAKWPL